jgi:hypothetical protein
VNPTPTQPPSIPGTSPVPGVVPQPAGALPPVTQPQPGAPPTPPGTTPPAANPARDQPPAATPTPAPGQAPPGTPAQIVVTTPGTIFQVAGGPYTVPVSINNASRLSVITLTVTYNPALLRVRMAQDGTFMRQGGVTATFTPRIDATNGRVEIAIARVSDQTGANGTGLLSVLIFDALAPGASTIGVSGIANAPDGTALPLTFSPITITVR